MSQEFLATQTRPTDESIILSYSESEFVHECLAAGLKIIKSNGQFWWETYPGFYQAIHWLAKMPATQAIRPTPFCWGYRTTVAEVDAKVANGMMPVHLLKDISQYDIGHLSVKRRNALRKSYNLVTVVELTGPAILNASGYDVFKSSMTRTGHSSIPTKDIYLKSLARHFMTQGTTLAGFIGNKLGGYLMGYAIGSTAYLDSLFLATEYLSTQIGTALVFEFVQICRRSGNIREVVYGQHSREDANLVAFKERMGFPVVHIPSIVHIDPFIGTMLRRLKPHVYYRLTGRG